MAYDKSGSVIPLKLEKSLVTVRKLQAELKEAIDEPLTRVHKSYRKRCPMDLIIPYRKQLNKTPTEHIFCSNHNFKCRVFQFSHSLISCRVNSLISTIGYK